MATIDQLERRVDVLAQRVAELIANNNLRPALADTAAVLVGDGAVDADKLASGAAKANIGAGGIEENELADGAVATAKIANLAVTDGKIAGLSIGKLLADDLDVAMNLGVGGKITVGDADPVSNGGVLIDDDEVTVYATNGKSATLNASGLVVNTEEGKNLLSIVGLDSADKAEPYMNNGSGGAGLTWEHTNNGAKSLEVAIDTTVTANTGLIVNDLWAFGTDAIAMLAMIACLQTDGTKIGHIFGMGGGLMYASNTDTEASSGRHDAALHRTERLERPLARRTRIPRHPLRRQGDRRVDAVGGRRWRASPQPGRTRRRRTGRPATVCVRPPSRSRSARTSSSWPSPTTTAATLATARASPR